MLEPYSRQVQGGSPECHRELYRSPRCLLYASSIVGVVFTKVRNVHSCMSSGCTW